MWSDNETTLDLINVQHLMSAVTGIVRTKALLPATIGVFGGWGSGKSSIIRMVQSELEKDERVICISFNGWLFEGYEDAKAALMGTILDELDDQLSLTETIRDKLNNQLPLTKEEGEVSKLAKKLIKRVDWFRLMGMAGKNLLSFTFTGLPSLDTFTQLPTLDTLAQGTAVVKEKVMGVDVEQIKELVQEAPESDTNLRQSVRQFREDFAELLKKSQVSTLVVFIDDLDRCLPNTVIETLEAIRLFLFVPNTAFIIGADEKLVYHAVKQRFPEIGGSTVDVGRDYLEKLVQIPVHIPPLSQVEVETYINLLFAQLHLEEDTFQKLTTKLLTDAPATIFDVGFNLQTAPDLLSLDQVPSDLAEDLTLAQQITDVLTTGLEGNPRQIKRFLNTLLLRLTMAKARQIDLRRRVLAKLMLLEYFKPESFRLLAKWQAEQAGKPDELRTLEQHVKGNGAFALEEKSNREVSRRAAGNSSENGASFVSRHQAGGVNPISTRAKVPEQAEPWLENDWLKDWLAMEPPLGDENLRPYFYFARENVGPLGGIVQRLSRPAREVLELFISPSKAQRLRAIKRVKSLTGADAAAIFQELANRVQRSEDLGADDSPLEALLRLVGKRPELIGECITLLSRMNSASIPPKVAPQIEQISKDTSNAKAAMILLKKWAKTTDNAALTFAAQKVLEKRKK